MTTSDWIEAQSKDKIVGDIIKMYKAKELQKGKETDSQEMRQFLKQRSKLFLRNRILYHKNDTKEIDCPDRNTMQLVLPKSFGTQALKGCHDDFGHLGVERTLDLFKISILLDWHDGTDNVGDACNLRHHPTEHPWKMLWQNILWNLCIWTI